VAKFGSDVDATGVEEVDHVWARGETEEQVLVRVNQFLER
jgi:hypothetical protein